MIRNSGLPVVMVPSNYEWTRYWQPAAEPPNHNGPVWGFCPDIGNDDDGYGQVLVVRYVCTARAWVDTFGAAVRVLYWAVLIEPESPVPATASR